MPKHPKKIYEQTLSFSDKIATRIAKFTGNMVFVWLHVVIFSGWIIINMIQKDLGWDPYPYNFLTMVVSLEAIFLSTFVLIAENRESRRNEIREQADYDVNVKAEGEIQELKKMMLQIQKKLEGK